MTTKNKVDSVIINILYAFIAQGVSMLFSMIMSLVVPKILEIEAYSYWQLFIFYSSYAGFFQCGINDGIYLKYGGMNFEDINKSHFTMQLFFETLILIFFQFLFFIFSALINDKNRKFVIFATGIYIVFYNISLYLGYVFQSVNKTIVFSKSVLIDRIIYIFALFFIYTLHIMSFQICIALFVGTRMIMMLYLVVKARKLFSYFSFLPEKILYESWNIMKIGLPLMMANIVSQLILGNARFFIDRVWGIETFGKCSFSITITNFFLLFIAQISMVLFPLLRRETLKKRNSIYIVLRKGLGLILPLIYICYIPLIVLLKWWLPQYENSFRYLVILLPICIFDSRMNLLCNTYYKTNRYERKLFKINMSIMIISIILNIFTIIFIKKLDFILYGITAVIMLRNIISQHYYESKQKIDKDILLAWNVIIAIIFILIYINFEYKFATILLLLCLLIFYMFNYEIIIRFIKQMKMELKL